jgi:YHS domain-containing protein
MKSHALRTAHASTRRRSFLLRQRGALLALVVLSGLSTAPGAQDADDEAEPPSPEAAAVRTLRIVQEANGLPNQPTRSPVRQELLVSEGRVRLEDPQSKIVYLLQLVDGETRVREVSLDGSQYTEGENLGELQRNRDISERQTLERLRKEPELVRQSTMRQLHLREGLERQVEVERTGRKETIFGLPCEQVIVRENDRVVIDAWLTSEVEFPIPFFRFYNRLGAFSGEVLRSIEEIEGFPLRVSFTVVTASLTYPISVEAVRPPEWLEAPAALFDIPAGAKKVERQELATCPTCGAQVEIAAAFRCGSYLGAQVYACSAGCKRDFLKKLAEERERRKRGEGN